MRRCILIVFLFNISLLYSSDIYLPLAITDRQNPELISLTEIGEFGLWRIDRPGIPGHFHTGIDLKRPNNNYIDEFILPLSRGVVISMRDDGPYAQLIIEHHIDGQVLWSLYEHIAGIQVEVGDSVYHDQRIARFMNLDELNTYGWQFNHFHFEILKVRPLQLRPSPKYPQRFFNSYTLICYTRNDLEKYFYNPFDFFK